MQENNNLITNNPTEELNIQKENIYIQNNNNTSIKDIDDKTEEIEKKLPKRSIELEDGTIIPNLKITYKNLFDFQNSYSGSKDLMEALVKKQTFDHETMVQLIYVGYLGTNPSKKMDYMEFIESINFSYKRDLELFQDLAGLKADSKN